MEHRINEIEETLKNARIIDESEISNEKDPAKVLLLEDKYMKEFNTKREALEKENKRLARSREITKMITEGIAYSPTSEKYIEKRIGGSR